MIDDKLTRSERRRLEALAQASANAAIRLNDDTDEIIARAEKYDKFIRGSENLS